jgi:hypothetical protein
VTSVYTESQATLQRGEGCIDASYDAPLRRDVKALHTPWVCGWLNRLVHYSALQWRHKPLSPRMATHPKSTRKLLPRLLQKAYDLKFVVSEYIKRYTKFAYIFRLHADLCTLVTVAQFLSATAHCLLHTSVESILNLLSKSWDLDPGDLRFLLQRTWARRCQGMIANPGAMW